jgi:hypothetical protein
LESILRDEKLDGAFIVVSAGHKEIRAIVAELSRPQKGVEPWSVGMFPTIELPSKAAPAEVTGVCVRAYAYPRGLIKQYRILAAETVFIPDDPPKPPVRYTAVLIASDLGKKIYLMQYIGHSRWWTRSFDAK